MISSSGSRPVNSMAEVEHHQGRTFTPVPECTFCFEPSDWEVTEDESGEKMSVCDWCKYQAFS